MNIKEIIHKCWKSIKDLWDKQLIQRFSRISYHIVWNIILFFITVGIVGGFFAFGIGAGYFASLVATTDIQTEDEMTKAVYNYEETSELYFADEVFLSEVSADILRDEISLDDVSEYVQQGLIATEDEYFEEHHGVVPKAIMRAMFQEVTNASTQTGGSTLTQQIIKNQLLTNEVSFERKAKEILLALRLEQFFEKDEILEAYLNIVPFGRNSSGQNIAGIETAAEGIFGVKASELNIPQSAFLAGLPQSPSSYTPFVNGGGLKDEEGLQPGLNRMKSVLNNMLDAGYITEEEYQEALDYDLVADFKAPEKSVKENYPYLMQELQERAIDILVEVLAEQDGYTKEDLELSPVLQEEYQIRASREIGSNGYKIHSTIDKEIYDAFQEVTKNYQNYGSDKLARNINNNQPIMIEDSETGEKVQLGQQPEQVGSILIENKTGKILSFVGGRDFDISQRNHATAVSRQNGSTMKPLVAYGPGIEKGVIQPGSVIADVQVNYPGGYSPNNFSRSFYGLTPVREALYRSHNATAVSVFDDIKGPDIVTDYLWKMGFTNMEEEQGSYSSLPLGSVNVTIEENTNAYATFGNSGNFKEAYMIEKIETKDGDIVFEHESEEVPVFNPKTNYLVLDMMRDVLTQGTATVARSNLANKNVDWAGKTGTSNDFRDSWFVATNPNVTLGTWIGYDYNQQLDDGYSSRNNILWAHYVNAATEANPEIMAPSEKFKQPDGIVNKSYCEVSGLSPSGICKDLGLVQSDIYDEDHVPERKDYSLVRGNSSSGDSSNKLNGNKSSIFFNPEWLEDMGYDDLPNIRQLTSRKTGAWEKILYPGLDAAVHKKDEQDEDEEEENALGAPSDLQQNGEALTWKASSSSDVIGYRMYRSTNPNSDDFSHIGSVTKTSYNIPDSFGIYYVRAVDSGGNESPPSNRVTVGSISPRSSDNEEEQEENEEAEQDNNEEDN
ncbi:transglycosylase domain-containing protein [Gracilibacillus alcaliphilus]|uniref:transglycosylase domain-containing protein n=1 Tax=Gracilibacillus alcaliphilus TaxID=1401441 RepID=UPI00195C8F06|nr:transglycosylase domain-containing protein [Gracilibacillus alcaliphilus]MBM7676851.1 penicillin-binding protein [Gracilibacillus alcaliphilus]